MHAASCVLCNCHSKQRQICCILSCYCKAHCLSAGNLISIARDVWSHCKILGARAVLKFYVHPGGGGYGHADGEPAGEVDSAKQNGNGVQDMKQRRGDYSALARVGGSVARYKADQESA